MRIHVMLLVVLAGPPGCTVSAGIEDGVFSCAEEPKQCPDGQTCEGGICRLQCVVPTTHTSIQTAISDLRCLEATVLDGFFTETLTFDRDFRLEGVDAAIVTLDAEQLGTAMTIESGAVTIRNMTITGGRADSGGGIHNSGTLALEGVVISGNSAISLSANGGGIYHVGANLTIEDSSITDNLAQAIDPMKATNAYGGGIYAAAPMTVSNTVISNNTAEATGGAGEGTYILAYGGGIMVQRTEVSLLEGTVIDGNQIVATVPPDKSKQPLARGGGIAALSSSVSLRGATISNNVAQSTHLVVEAMLSGSSSTGGGIELENSSASIEGTTIEGNQADSSGVNAVCLGAGIQQRAGAASASLDLNEVSVRGNHCGGERVAAGGVAVASDLDAETGTLTVRIRRTAIIRNEAIGTASSDLEGAGLWLQNSNNGALDARIENSTISGNTIGGTGLGVGAGIGLIIFNGAPSIGLANLTVSDNHVNTASDDSKGGGLFVKFGGTALITMQNSILAGNGAASDPDCNAQNTTIRGNGDNLINATAGCLIDTTRPNLVSNTPGLLPLSDYGGKTETHNLMPTSEARDAGNPNGCVGGSGELLDFDQRGMTRTFGPRCDIGALEYR